jgi:hypothetical protein
MSGELPAIGSVWRAPDGRIMQLVLWHAPNKFGTQSARMVVLNPKKGQRHVTQAALQEFGKHLLPYNGPLPI